MELINESGLDIKSNNQRLIIRTNDLIPGIEEIIEKIQSIVENSEDDILQIGKKLKDFLSDSKELFQMSSSVSSMITYEVLKKGVLELNGLLSEFSKRLAKSVNNIGNDKEELLNIIEKINLIIYQMGDFRKIVKQLRMLGISIKIESSRLGDGGNEFFILAENVDNLSHQISDKSENILKKSKSLFSEITKTINGLENLEIKQREQTDIILNETIHTINTFEQNYNNSYEMTDDIVKSSDKVTNSINNIVTSLQSHDIIRQKMEHSVEALNNLSVSLKKSEMSDNTTEISVTNLNVTHDVCELQIIQLNDSVSEFTAAILNIISNLSSVNQNVSSINSKTTSLLGPDSIFSDKSLLIIQEELNAILTGLIKSSEISRELAKSIKSIVGIVSDLTKSVFEIEEVGNEIEIIALNARVKAARTGIKGSSLDVLAEAIQKLSLDAKNHTGSISTVLNIISEISQRLNMESDLVVNEEDNIDSTKKKISEILNSFSDIGTKTSTVLKKFQNKVNNLKSDIIITINSIAIHDWVKEKVSNIIEELTLIVNEIKNFGVFSSDRERNTNGLMKKYTMHSERKIHQSYTGDNNTSSNKSIIGNQLSKDNSFGDNVELF